MSISRSLYLNFIFLIITISTISAKNDLFTIMIDPAGDAKHTGRLIQDTLERGISLQCAEELKKVIMQKYSNVRVIITRVPGETIQPLQTAAFINRLDADLSLSLYFYYEHNNPAYITLYHYLENPVVDFWHKPINLCFYNVNQAYLANLTKTKQWGLEILQVLQNKKISKHFEPRGLFGIPFKPLLGIKSPALAFEIGLKNKNDWQHIIDPLVQALEKIIS